MAQIPQQQVQVYQHALPSQFQPVYLPQSQYLTLQPTPYRAPVFQNVAPTQAHLHLQQKSNLDLKAGIQNAQRSSVLLQSQYYAQTSNEVLQKQLPAHSRIITAHDLSSMCGHTQILGPYTFSSLPPGYSWVHPGQYQNPIVRTHQHPGIYAKSVAPNSVQLPFPAIQQDTTVTSYIANSQVCQETQTVVAPAVVSSVENCDSSVPSQVDTNSDMTIKPPACSSTILPLDAPTQPPALPTTLHPTPQIVDCTVYFKAEPPESPMQLESDLQNEPAPEPMQECCSKEEDTVQSSIDTPAVPSEVSSTTAVEIDHQDSPEMYSYAIIPSSPLPQLDDMSDYEDNSSRSASEVEHTNGCYPPQHFNPVIKLKRLKPHDLLGSSKDKQLQRAIVKPQIVPQTSDGNGMPKNSEPFQAVESFPNSPRKLITAKGRNFEKRFCRSLSGSSSSENKESTQEYSGFKPRRRGRPRKKERFHKKKSLQSLPTAQVSNKSSNSKADSDISACDQPTATSMETAPLEPYFNPTLPSDILTALKGDQMEMELPQNMLSNWSVEEVFQFLKSSKDCSSYADMFKSEEIDGQALSLLKLEHLMTGMSMKLGHAVKLLSDIDNLKNHQECS